MSWTKNAFTIIIPTDSPAIDVLYKVFTTLDPDPHWDTNLYDSSYFVLLDNGDYIGKSMKVITGSGVLALVHAFVEKVDDVYTYLFGDPIFASLGLTEPEFDALRASELVIDFDITLEAMAVNEGRSIYDPYPEDE